MAFAYWTVGVVPLVSCVSNINTTKDIRHPLYNKQTCLQSVGWRTRRHFLFYFLYDFNVVSFLYTFCIFIAVFFGFMVFCLCFLLLFFLCIIILLYFSLVFALFYTHFFELSLFIPASVRLLSDDKVMLIVVCSEHKYLICWSN